MSDSCPILKHYVYVNIASVGQRETGQGPPARPDPVTFAYPDSK